MIHSENRLVIEIPQKLMKLFHRFRWTTRRGKRQPLGDQALLEFAFFVRHAERDSRLHTTMEMARVEKQFDTATRKQLTQFLEFLRNHRAGIEMASDYYKGKRVRVHRLKPDRPRIRNATRWSGPVSKVQVDAGAYYAGRAAARSAMGRVPDRDTLWYQVQQESIGRLWLPENIPDELLVGRDFQTRQSRSNVANSFQVRGVGEPGSTIHSGLTVAPSRFS